MGCFSIYLKPFNNGLIISTWQNLIYNILNAKLPRHNVTKNLNSTPFRLCDSEFKNINYFLRHTYC